MSYPNRSQPVGGEPPSSKLAHLAQLIGSKRDDNPLRALLVGLKKSNEQNSAQSCNTVTDDTRRDQAVTNHVGPSQTMRKEIQPIQTVSNHVQPSQVVVNHIQTSPMVSSPVQLNKVVSSSPVQPRQVGVVNVQPNPMAYNQIQPSPTSQPQPRLLVPNNSILQALGFPDYALAGSVAQPQHVSPYPIKNPPPYPHPSPTNAVGGGVVANGLPHPIPPPPPQRSEAQNLPPAVQHSPYPIVHQLFNSRHNNTSTPQGLSGHPTPVVSPSPQTPLSSSSSQSPAAVFNLSPNVSPSVQSIHPVRFDAPSKENSSNTVTSQPGARRLPTLAPSILLQSNNSNPSPPKVLPMSSPKQPVVNFEQISFVLSGLNRISGMNRMTTTPATNASLPATTKPTTNTLSESLDQSRTLENERLTAEAPFNGGGIPPSADNFTTPEIKEEVIEIGEEEDDCVLTSIDLSQRIYYLQRKVHDSVIDLVSSDEISDSDPVIKVEPDSEGAYAMDVSEPTGDIAIETDNIGGNEDNTVVDIEGNDDVDNKDNIDAVVKDAEYSGDNVIDKVNTADSNSGYAPSNDNMLAETQINDTVGVKSEDEKSFVNVVDDASDHPGEVPETGYITPKATVMSESVNAAKPVQLLAAPKSNSGLNMGNILNKFSFLLTAMHGKPNVEQSNQPAGAQSSSLKEIPDGNKKRGSKRTSQVNGCDNGDIDLESDRDVVGDFGDDDDDYEDSATDLRGTNDLSTLGKSPGSKSCTVAIERIGTRNKRKASSPVIDEGLASKTATTANIKKNSTSGKADKVTADNPSKKRRQKPGPKPRAKRMKLDSDEEFVPSKKPQNDSADKNSKHTSNKSAPVTRHKSRRVSGDAPTDDDSNPNSSIKSPSISNQTNVESKIKKDQITSKAQTTITQVTAVTPSKVEDQLSNQTRTTVTPESVNRNVDTVRAQPTPDGQEGGSSSSSHKVDLSHDGSGSDLSVSDDDSSCDSLSESDSSEEDADVAYTCKLCHIAFQRKKGLKKHLKTKHYTGEAKKIEKTIPCKACRRKFSDVTALQAHLLQRRYCFFDCTRAFWKRKGDSPKACKMCGKGVAKWKDLKKHSYRDLTCRLRFINVILDNTKRVSRHHSEEKRLDSDVTCNDKRRTSESEDKMKSSGHADGKTELDTMGSNDKHVANQESEMEEDAEDLSDDRNVETNQNKAPENSYLCKPCETQFKTPLLFRNHLNEKNSCKYYFLNPRNESPTSLNYCPGCEMFLESASRLLNHACSKEKMSKCNVCSRLFNDDRGLRIHQSRSDCGSVDRRKDDSNQVQSNDATPTTNSDQGPSAESHRKDPSDKDGFKCLVCKTVFMQVHDLLDHSHSHIEEQNYNCDICEMTFNRYNGLVSHMIWHKRKSELIDSNVNEGSNIKTGNSESSEKLACDQCSSTFDTLQALASHVATHQAAKNDEMFNCPKCPLKFKKKCHLSLHYVKHARAQAKQQRSAMMTESLKSKMPMEKDDTLFSCSLCRQQFSTLSGRNEHFKSCQKENKSDSSLSMEETSDSQPSTAFSMWNCILCAKVLKEDSFRLHFKRHVIKMKLDIKEKFDSLGPDHYQPQCEVCNKDMGSVRTLREHIDRHRCADIMIRASKVENVQPTNKANLKDLKEELESDQESPSPSKGQKRKIARLTYSFSCKECGKKFLNMPAFKFHLKIVHKHRNSEGWSEYCNYLKESPDTSETAPSDVREDRSSKSPVEAKKVKTSTCEICHKEIQNLIRHMHEVHGLPKHHFYAGNKSVKNSEMSPGLAWIKKDNGGMDIISSQTLNTNHPVPKECQVCKQTFLSPKHLWRHQFDHVKPCSVGVTRLEQAIREVPKDLEFSGQNNADGSMGDTSYDGDDGNTEDSAVESAHSMDPSDDNGETVEPEAADGEESVDADSEEGSKQSGGNENAVKEETDDDRNRVKNFANLLQNLLGPPKSVFGVGLKYA